MAIVRETIWKALFAKLTASASFETAARRPYLPPDNTVAVPLNQPAIFLVEGDEEQTQRRNLPNTAVLTGQIWIYCKTPDPQTPGATILNPLLDAVDAAMAPDDVAQNVMTLGGLVTHCWIEGKVIKVVGDLNPDGQCFASIPVRILVPT